MALKLTGKNDFCRRLKEYALLIPKTPAKTSSPAPAAGPLVAPRSTMMARTGLTLALLRSRSLRPTLMVSTR